MHKARKGLRSSLLGRAVITCYGILCTPTSMYLQTTKKFENFLAICIGVLLRVDMLGAKETKSTGFAAFEH